MHLSVPAFMVETGQTIYPHGWKCDTFGLGTGERGSYAFTI
jgi:hypothetical protein